VPEYDRRVAARLSLLLVLASALAAATAVAGPTGERASLRPYLAIAQAVAAPAPRCPVPPRFRPAFEAAVRETRVPMAMLLAVAEVESGLRPDAVSPKGARGLLQLMPATAAELQLDPDHPPSNVLGGARYLRRMLDLFSSTTLALAAYHAGPTAVAEAGGPPAADTAAYVAVVTARWRALAGCG